MNIKAPLLFTLAAVTFLAVHSSLAATIPAGATLTVRTLQTISSRDSQGKTFTAELDHNVVVNGKVALRAGTKFAGKIESSPTDPRRTRPLTVNLTGVVTGDRTVPIKTTGAFTIQQQGWTTARRGIAVSGGGYLAAAGAKLQFRLAQPLNI
jgi:hypothetical protein